MPMKINVFRRLYPIRFTQLTHTLGGSMKRSPRGEIGARLLSLPRRLLLSLRLAAHQRVVASQTFTVPLTSQEERVCHRGTRIDLRRADQAHKAMPGK